MYKALKDILRGAEDGIHRTVDYEIRQLSNPEYSRLYNFGQSTGELAAKTISYIFFRIPASIPGIDKAFKEKSDLERKTEES